MNKKDLSWKIYSLLPIILILIFLTLIPLVNIFYNSFFDIRWNDGAYVYTFIGLQNYLELPNNKFYFPGLKNTVKLALHTSVPSPTPSFGVTQALQLSPIEVSWLTIKLVSL